MQIETTVTVPHLLDEKEAGAIIGKSRKWMELDRRTGPTIPYVKMGRHVRYRVSDLLAYIESNTVPAE
ncbi:helix-turn-helix domain-containing protein [Silicimonas sp. MF1-12-2]|uniref:helix-turn-helix domain-containing protein n=1 Tax=Silicimonas sp. MF1-12-2 TaxID=3384793 RepID=UPI0039B44F4D